MNIRKLTEGGLIAAIYTVLTIALAPISFGAMQCRVSEALFVLSRYTGAAVSGLFVGCALSAILTGAPLLDIALGSLATLGAAYTTRVLSKRGVSKWLLPLPTVLFNAVIVGWVVNFLYSPDIPLALCMLYVGAGEAIACYVLGIPLFMLLDRHKEKIFR
ncbi:MAG: QueT transporter family protein [Clostridia bacterium]|nr:QueT transporter family protein [Clostridia bacterium]